MRVVVIIPTYNEKENIALMLDALIKIAASNKSDSYKFLVVDDNSPDGTGEIVKKFKFKYKSKIELLTGKKEGLGEAMIRGYEYCLGKLKPDAVVSTEADFAYDPKYIPFSINKIKEGYDVVIASRHVAKGETQGWTLNRKINHWIANKFFATWIAGVTEVHDHNGAFRAIRVKGVLERINFKKLKVMGFGFFNYFLFKLSRVTDKFYEFPVTYKFRTRGESKVSFNPKYLNTYLHDVFEYIKLSLMIRTEKMGIKI